MGYSRHHFMRCRKYFTQKLLAPILTQESEILDQDLDKVKGEKI